MSQRNLPAVDHDLLSLIIILIIAVMLAYLLLFSGISDESLERDSEILVNALVVDGDAVGDVGTVFVDAEKLAELERYDYQELKAMLGVENDFVVYFKDDEGNVLDFRPKKRCLGDPEVALNGGSC